MLNRFFIGGIIFSCLLLGGCKKGIPKDIIQPAKTEQLLYDYHMAKAMADELSYEEKYKQPLYINYVLEKHHTTQAEFDSSMVWYTRHTDQLSKIYENINKRYKKEQETINHLIAIRDNKPKETQPGDSINVWYGNPLNMLTNYITSNKLKFDIPADTNFKQHDELVWKMRYTFLSNKHIPDTAVMAMYMRYENDSLIQVVKKVVRSGVDSLVLKSDSAYQMKELKGFIYYPGNDKKKVLLIDNVTLMRYHHPQADSISVSKSDSIKDDNDLKQPEISVNNRHRSAAAKDMQKKDEIQLQQR